MVDQIYQSCVVSILGYDTTAYLILLDILNFNLILGIDWLSPHRLVLDCYFKTVR